MGPQIRNWPRIQDFFLSPFVPVSGLNRRLCAPASFTGGRFSTSPPGKPGLVNRSAYSADRKRSASDHVAWFIARSSMTRDGLMAGQLWPLALCVPVQRDTWTISTGADSCTVQRTPAANDCGLTSVVLVAIWGSSSSDASVKRHVVYTRPRNWT
jgi:hypothetical protein